MKLSGSHSQQSTKLSSRPTHLQVVPKFPSGQLLRLNLEADPWKYPPDNHLLQVSIWPVTMLKVSRRR
jgi:hypothetical protein